jgi:hypothetical protein
VLNLIPNEIDETASSFTFAVTLPKRPYGIITQRPRQYLATIAAYDISNLTALKSKRRDNLWSLAPFMLHHVCQVYGPKLCTDRCFETSKIFNTASQFYLLTFETAKQHVVSFLFRPDTDVVPMPAQSYL